MNEIKHRQRNRNGQAKEQTPNNTQDKEKN